MWSLLNQYKQTHEAWLWNNKTTILLGIFYWLPVEYTFQSEMKKLIYIFYTVSFHICFICCRSEIVHLIQLYFLLNNVTFCGENTVNNLSRLACKSKHVKCANKQTDSSIHQILLTFHRLLFLSRLPIPITLKVTSVSDFR